jgi:hypothetical protein
MDGSVLMRQEKNEHRCRHPGEGRDRFKTDRLVVHFDRPSAREERFRPSPE